MIGVLGFAYPALLLLLLPWLLGLWLWGRGQLAAVRWIRTHVDARFRHRLTRHDPKSLFRHLVFLAISGALLVVAAAGPTISGETEVTADSAHVLLMIDASASMNAGDVQVPTLEGDADAPKNNRFEQARWIARDLVRALPDARFGMVTFSGEASLQLPLESDRGLLEEALRVVELNNYYTNTGSSFTSALDAVLRFSDRLSRDPASAGGEAEPGSGKIDLGEIDLQVVLLSDGEIPTLEDGSQPPNSDYSDALAAVVARGIPVHTVAIGSLEGETRLIYDFRDVVAGKAADERRVLREYSTRRQEQHLRRMARSTGGTTAMAESIGTAESAAVVIASAIENRPARGGWLAKADGGRDISHWPLALFVLTLLVELLWMGRAARREPGDDGPEGDGPGSGAAEAFRLDRLGTAMLVLGVAVSMIHGCGGDGSSLERAHQENERGIDLDALGQRSLARRHYERSRSFGRDAHIPTHNLARSLALDERFAEAHDAFQEALELQPELADAHFNDGVTFYLWGDAERDPEGCRLERTLELWGHARDRFASTLDFAEPDSELSANADANYRAVDEQLETLREWIENPPPECQSSSQSPSGGSENEENDDNGDDDDRSGDGGGGSGEGDPGQQPPPPPDPQGQQGQQGQQPPPPPDPQGQQGQQPPPPPDPQGQQGQQPPPQGQGSGSSGGLTEADQQAIAEAMARIAQQRLEAGKYHRRTRDEQFPEASWKNPEAIIWW